MAALSSTVPAVKAALVTLITADVNDSTVQVSYGRPPDNQLARECIYVGDVPSGAQRVPTLKAGRKAREEKYPIEVVVAVLAAGGTLSAAETRAFVLLSSVEDVVADDPSLGGVAGLIHATAGTFDVTSGYTAEGPVCVIRFQVDCTARLA